MKFLTKMISHNAREEGTRMNRRSIAAIFTVAFVLAGAAAAFAATQEYDISVPLDLKNVKDWKGALPAGITISCAVGRGSLAYSTASGGATGATGSGSTHLSFRDATGKVLVANPQVPPVVVVTEEAPTGIATSAQQYLCWGKFDGNGTTPVNFISGAIK